MIEVCWTMDDKINGSKVLYVYDVSTIVLLVLLGIFFFFKQKTAYEMRISDWSSDVCSSDLLRHHPADRACGSGDGGCAGRSRGVAPDQPDDRRDRLIGQIGRASCRERVCQYV